MTNDSPKVGNPGFSHYVGLANQLIQIIALVIAGIWALWTWNQTTAPSLITSLELAGEVEATWSRLFQACIGELTMTVENISPRKITVSRTEYEIVKAKLERLEPSETIKVLGTLPASTEPIAKGQFDPPILVGEYPPKAKAHQTLAFLISPNEEAEIWFQVDLFDQSDELIAYWFGAVEPCQEEDMGKKGKRAEP